MHYNVLSLSFSLSLSLIDKSFRSSPRFIGVNVFNRTKRPRLSCGSSQPLPRIRLAADRGAAVEKTVEARPTVMASPERALNVGIYASMESAGERYVRFHSRFPFFFLIIHRNSDDAELF